MTAAVRDMRWWDIAAVMRLEHDLFPEDAWTEGVFWSELAQAGSRRYVVAEVEGDVAGYAGLCAYDAQEAYVQTIGVAAEHQRSGVGTQLLTTLLAEAATRGSRRVDLEVRADNAPAITLYERHGFRSIGVRRRYYQPSGTDAVVMRREPA